MSDKLFHYNYLKRVRLQFYYLPMPKIGVEYLSYTIYLSIKISGESLLWIFG